MIAWLVLNEDIREHERPVERGELLDGPIQDVTDIADVIPHPSRKFAHAVDIKDGKHDVVGQMVVDQDKSAVVALFGQVDERASDCVLTDAG